MPKLIIVDVDSRFNGEYDADIKDLTNRELHFVRLQSGISPTGIIGALLEQDAAVTVALTAIALERLGKQPDLLTLWDAPGGLIRFDFKPEQTEAAADLPPKMPPNGGSETETEAETDVASSSPGQPSNASSDSPEGDPKASGDHGSGTTADSEPEISET